MSWDYSLKNRRSIVSCHDECSRLGADERKWKVNGEHHEPRAPSRRVNPPLLSNLPLGKACSVNLFLDARAIENQLEHFSLPL